MNKFTKIILITVCILFGLGLLLTGGMYYFQKLSPIAENDPDQGSFTKLIDAKEIKEVHIDMSYGDVVFTEGSEWSVYFDRVYIPKADAEVTDGFLKIETGTPGDIKLFGWRLGFNIDFNTEKRAKVTITYPAGTKLNVIDSQLGQGGLYAKGISAESLICQTCAGKVELKDSKIEREASVQVVLGSFEAENTKFRNSFVKMAIGNCSINTDETSRLADVETEIWLGGKNGKLTGFWK